MNNAVISTLAFKELKTVAALATPEGMRVVRIIKKKGLTSLGGYLPRISDAELAEFVAKPDVTEWVRSKIEEVQDSILRPVAVAEGSQYESYDANLNAVLLAIAAEKESGRLSKGAIEKWFASDMAPRLKLALLAKQLPDAAMAGALKMFQEGFVLLAGKEPSMKAALKAQLEKALGLFEEDYSSRIAEQIATKLIDVQEATVQDVL